MHHDSNCTYISILKYVIFSVSWYCPAGCNFVHKVSSHPPSLQGTDLPRLVKSTSERVQFFLHTASKRCCPFLYRTWTTAVTSLHSHFLSHMLHFSFFTQNQPQWLEEEVMPIHKRSAWGTYHQVSPRGLFLWLYSPCFCTSCPAWPWSICLGQHDIQQGSVFHNFIWGLWFRLHDHPPMKAVFVHYKLSWCSYAYVEGLFSFTNFMVQLNWGLTVSTTATLEYNWMYIQLNMAMKKKKM